MGQRQIFKCFVGLTSPYAKSQIDYRDGEDDYGEYDDEYYEDYDYITNPDTFGTLKDCIFLFDCIKYYIFKL